MATYTCGSQAIAAYQAAGFSVSTCLLSLAPHFTGGNGCLSGVPAPTPASTLGFNGSALWQYISAGYCNPAGSTILIEADGRITYISAYQYPDESVQTSSATRWASQVFGDEEFRIVNAQSVISMYNGAYADTFIIGNYNFLWSWGGFNSTGNYGGSGWLPIGNYVQLTAQVSGIGQGVNEYAQAYLTGTLELRRSSQPATVISTNFYVSADGSCPV